MVATYYSLAKITDLKWLDPVHNLAIRRLSTGAFHSSSVKSLYAKSGDTPLMHRRMKIALQYYAG